MKQLIFALVIALLAVIFALQNATTVTVNLFFWDITLSLALLIIILLISGIAIGLLLMSKKVYHKNLEVKTLQKQVKNSTTNIAK
jgi:lipopolysaccharide assembly protein A